VDNVPGFLSDEEKLEYFFKEADINQTEYPATTKVKVFEGAEVYTYYLDSRGDIVITGLLVCTNICTNSEGVKVTFLERRTNGIHVASDVPKFVIPQDIVMYTPHACFIERTVKRTRSGLLLRGCTTSVTFRTKSDPNRMEVLQTQAVSALRISELFTEEEIDLAFARLEVEDDC
jgi:hypothetical protein